MENTKAASPKILDRLTQLYIRAYLTPQRIAQFHPTRNPPCPLRASTPGSFFLLYMGLPGDTDLLDPGNMLPTCLDGITSCVRPQIVFTGTTPRHGN